MVTSLLPEHTHPSHREFRGFSFNGFYKMAQLTNRLVKVELLLQNTNAMEVPFMTWGFNLTVKLSHSDFAILQEMSIMLMQLPVI
jgi:hypothetical protein